ncbi:hypothetical protein AB0K52_15125 [Glycomyces sp. NPDC049804]|uniref:hypothetical protein n=1 Tax=Glycomyces sp. NPDC049804 TaxID=3154363 RepID=UPI0034364480
MSEPVHGHRWARSEPGKTPLPWSRCLRCHCFVAIFEQPMWRGATRIRKRWFHPDGLVETMQLDAMEPPCPADFPDYDTTRKETNR